jgi:hypothetical protein
MVEHIDKLADFSIDLSRRCRSARLCGRRKSSQCVGIDLRRLYVERDVDPDRPTTAAERQMNSLFQMISNGERVFDCYRVFGNRADYRDNIDFLYAHDADAGIAFQIASLDLSRDEHYRGGIQPCPCYPGHCVRPARSSGHQSGTESVCHSGVSFRGNGNRLFMEVADIAESSASP